MKLVPRKGPREEWIDLHVEIKLGDWYKIDHIVAHGNTAISTRELEEAFNHCCFRWGRFGLQRMRDDARAPNSPARTRLPGGARDPRVRVREPDTDPISRRVTCRCR